MLSTNWKPLHHVATSSGRRARQGTALLELALVMPILAALLLGVLDFGRMYAEQLAVTSAAREGARAAMHDTSDTNVRNVVTNELNGAVVPNSSGSSCGNAICINRDTVNGQVVVTVNYTHSFLFGLIRNGDLALAASATMPYTAP
ncbi:MAG TPA: TadE/TadG family type IV pilus assembly protein [Chloroflexia bacterium]